MMSKYRGLFTFDTDNHKYVPMVQADGIIDLNDTTDYVPTESLIKGKEYIDLFKHWAKVNEDSLDKTDKKFIYREDDDMLFYNASTPRCAYGIGFISTEALEDLEDGKLYSYYDLVGDRE